MTKIDQERTRWIDSSRGIAIILVVFCHIYFEHTRTYIYSFIIPLFFFISGFLHKRDKYKNTQHFIRSRINNLLHPYLIWSIILFTFWALFDSSQYSIGKGFVGIFYGICSHEFMDWGMMLWFIPTLFLTEVIYDTVIRKFSSPSIPIVLLTISGFTYSHFINFEIPWNLNISLVMLSFYYLGNISVKFLNNITIKQRIIALPLLLISYYLSSKLNGDIYSEKGFLKILYYI